LWLSLASNRMRLVPATLGAWCGAWCIVQPSSRRTSISASAVVPHTTRVPPTAADKPCNACNKIVSASSSTSLRRILRAQLVGSDISSRPRYVFFDLDECLVMPSAPFIDGLPGSDALVRRLRALCGQEVLAGLRQRMVEAYYDAPVALVDAGLPEIIASLRARGVRVHGLTSRGATREVWAYADHNDKVIDALSRHQIKFSPLPPSRLGELGANTRAGGILYAGGEHVDKSAVMQQVTAGAPATLVDNSEHKLVKATTVGRGACVHGVHFTAAWAREASDAERRRWICFEPVRGSGAWGAAVESMGEFMA